MHNEENRISSAFMQQEIAMGVIYIVAGSVLTNFTLVHSDSGCASQRDFVWLYVEGIRTCLAGAICFVNAAISFTAIRDAADGALSNSSARAIQCMALLNCCQCVFIGAFAVCWLLYGLVNFLLLGEDSYEISDCEQLYKMVSFEPD